MLRRMKISFIFLLCAILFSQSTLAQFYSTGQDPASAKWEQIKTDNFQVIFQKDFRSQGLKIANILEYYYDKAGNTFIEVPDDGEEYLVVFSATTGEEIEYKEWVID